MARNNIALVFPGQGSQAVGMLKELAAQYPQVEMTFAEATQILGYNLWDLVQNGPEEKLNQTEFTQPALLTAEFAMWRIWQQKHFEQMPICFAGHSLGEYSALVAAQAISFADAISLVRDRGRFMQEAFAPNQGGMVAVIGLDDVILSKICSEINTEFNDQFAITPANYNSVGQTVLSGKIEAAKRAVTLAKAAGAKMSMLLPVSVPSHCELMRPASVKLAGRLAEIKIIVPKVPVIHNYSVVSYSDPKQIREALINQLTSPVRWVETISFMLNQKDVTEVVECGPGKVLTGLNKRISKDTGIKFISYGEALS